MKVKDGDQFWITPWGSCLSDKQMGLCDYTLDTPAPTSVREALDLVWELAHPVKEGQHIPDGTRLLDRLDSNDFSVYTTKVDFIINAGEALSIRTLEPLPEPDWLDAPAVLASTSMCPDREVWVPVSGGVWKCSCCRDERHWYELIDVTPLWPKGQDA